MSRVGRHWENILNVNFYNNDKRQDCQIGRVCGGVLEGGGRVNEGD
jgi:hypothetical protein